MKRSRKRRISQGSSSTSTKVRSVRHHLMLIRKEFKKPVGENSESQLSYEDEKELDELHGLDGW